MEVELRQARGGPGSAGRRERKASGRPVGAQEGPEKTHGSRRGYAQTMPQLVLLRHGQSQWNAENLFTGWVDVDLTELGCSEAEQAGRLLGAETGLDLRILHTSLQTRAIRTAELALEAAGRPWLPVRRHWRLNERHYGALQGKNKKETTDEHGKAQVDGLAQGVCHPASARRARQQVRPGRRPPISGRTRRGPSHLGVPGRRGGPGPALLGGRHRAGPVVRRPTGWSGPGGRPRQQPAGLAQAHRRYLRRGHRQPRHPDRHPVPLRAGR